MRLCKRLKFNWLSSHVDIRIDSFDGFGFSFHTAAHVGRPKDRSPKETMMWNNTLAATRLAALSQAARPTAKILRTILLVLPLLSMPAFASHLHHLWYNNSNWQDQDLTALTGGATSYGAGVAAFYTTPNQ